MRNRIVLLAALALGAAPAAAQLAVPSLGGAVDRILDTAGAALDPLARAPQGIARDAATLARARTERLADLVRRNRATIERDAAGAPARKGELLVLDPTEGALATASAAGFVVIGRETMPELGITVARLAVPGAMALGRAEALLRQRLPGATITADTLHEPAGALAAAGAGAALPAPPIETPVGLIDGAAGSSIHAAAVRGFARGAPRASDHGSATASLLAGAGVRRLFIADVYGADPAGGDALAIARALEWLTGAGVHVVSISLVGPDNPVVARAIAGARRRGTVIVAAVGNDGPAAPPAYPASYPGVIAVTGVDGRNRALIEAGRALHLDYAAPGADMIAADARGRRVRVRGTSFAAPLAAARAAAAFPAGPVEPTLDREARPIGSPALYGRGLLCGACRQAR
ncbi:MAG: S8 family serine peptidase [Sphingomonadales bacterium]|nr:S8 family serine peptidase [Sphingomonadales bacterium]